MVSSAQNDGAVSSDTLQQNDGAISSAQNAEEALAQRAFERATQCSVVTCKGEPVTRVQRRYSFGYATFAMCLKHGALDPSKPIGVSVPRR